MTIRRGLPPLLISFLVAGLVTGCSSDEPPKVQFAAVTRATVNEVVEAPATVGARATATLTTPASGTVAKLYVEDGDTVDKGQILAKISSPQAEDQLDEARKAQKQASKPVSMGSATPSINLPKLKVSGSLDAQVRRYLAKARKAADKIEDRNIRAQLLSAIDAAEAQQKAQQRAVSEVVNGLNQSLNRILSQVTGQLGAGLSGLGSSMSSLRAASVTQARTVAKAAETTVKGLVIKAPFDGVVTLGGASGGGGSADLGALAAQLPASVSGQMGGSAGTGRSGGTIAKGVPVATGDTIATVTDVSKLTLSADVDETDVLLVEKGTRAEIEFDAVPGAVYTAKVTGVGVTPKEGATGGVSYPVRLSLGKGTFDDGAPAPRPKPGMSAVVRLTVREAPDTVAVPASAIVSSGKESVVWAVRSGKAERQVVKLGAQGDAEVEILNGLTVGERVVVKGADTVRAGQQLS